MSINRQSLFPLSFITTTILAITSGFAYFFQLPPVIPLFYSFSRTQQHLAQKEFIFLLPALSFIFSIFVVLFGKNKYVHENPVSMVLLHSSSLIFSLFSWLIFIRIIILVT